MGATQLEIKQIKNEKKKTIKTERLHTLNSVVKTILLSDLIYVFCFGPSPIVRVSSLQRSSVFFWECTCGFE